MTKPTTVDEYVDAAPEVRLPVLRRLRELALANAPDATEGLKWSHPAYWTSTILFVFSGHKEHASIVFTPSTRVAFDDELTGFETGAGSVRLPYDRPLPEDLIARMIRYRVRELAEDGVTWR